MKTINFSVFVMFDYFTKKYTKIKKDNKILYTLVIKCDKMKIVTLKYNIENTKRSTSLSLILYYMVYGVW